MFLDDHIIFKVFSCFSNDEGEMKMMRMIKLMMDPGDIMHWVCRNMVRANPDWTIGTMFIEILNAS